MTSGELQRETRALREAHKDHSLRRDALLVQMRDQAFDHLQRRRQAGFVLLDLRQERIGIPGVICRLRRQVRDVGNCEFMREAKNVFGRGAAAVNQDGRQPRVSRCGSQRQDRLVFVRMRIQSMAFRLATICRRCDSRKGGSTTVSPSVASSSSTPKPGPSLAISNSTPFGSRV